MSVQTGKLNGGHSDEASESVFIYCVVTVPRLLVVFVWELAFTYVVVNKLKIKWITKTVIRGRIFLSEPHQL